MKFSNFGPLFLAIGLGLFVGHGQADITATNLFETIPSGTDGNCVGKPIDTMVQEAVMLNDKAIAAINVLLEPKLFWSGGNDERIAKIASAIWGVQLDKPMIYAGFRFRIDDSGRDTLTKAKTNYELANEKLNSNSVNGGKLTCGGKDWQYVATWEDLGYKGNTEPVDKYVSKYFSQKDDQGRYIIEPGKIIITEQTRNGKSLAGKSLCDDPGRAQTWTVSHLIMMCDQCFDQPTLSTLEGQQGSWPSGKHMDDIQTAGAEFQHEMLHYIGKGIGDTDMGNGEAGYGWENCAIIASQPGQLALKNADNYRVFAMAVFFSQISWDEYGEKP
ncbi:hypothetical protein N7474_010945 [Penicillium riverlandense]|uniref:uncharacterized protein n=1 Tax=Penicillium riverlandense TaxID=1903569 RepID=UPI002548C00C|nr:uncharacterized protein N7474_010945 [Penicillium riverlandense]KAJ5805058.1 hypothetical protein N7474_010945 [Penicillium riverlandense]